ncbi:RloB family protein [Streptosporangium sandarakinum]
MTKKAKGKEALLPVHGGNGRRRSIYVFTEGRVTEPTYIEAIKSLAEVKVNIHLANQKVSDADRKPSDLVAAAIKLLERKRHEDDRARLPPRLRTQVWCIFDHDGRERNELTGLLARADKSGVEIAFSNPCFEVWRLSHLKSVTGTFGGVCRQAEVRLPPAFGQVLGGIKYVTPDQIEKRFSIARRNAEQMNGQHPEHTALPSRDPYTDVYRFVKEGMGVEEY